MTEEKKLDSEPKVEKSESTSPESNKSQPEKATKPESGKPQPKKAAEPESAKPQSKKETESESAKSEPKKEAKSEAPSPKTDEAHKPAKRLALTAIVISLITAGAGFYALQQQNQQLSQQLAEVTRQLQSSQQEITAQQQQMTTQLQANQQKVEQSTNEAVNRAEVLVEQQQKSIESLQLALSDVKGRRPNDWLLAEADYLVKLAGKKLFLEHDVVTATKLMESADQRVATLNDPSLVPLRQAMANDITELRSLPLLDKDGVALQLISLQEKVDQLPLANAILPEAEETVQKQVSTDINDWQQNLTTSLENFVDNFITFRVRDGSAIPLLSPEQHFYLRENIKAKIETAIRATYSEQKEIYQQALKVALEWSSAYLDQDAASVNDFNQSLQTLSKVEIDLNYPDKLETNKVLSGIIQDRLRREVTTIITEESK